MWVTEDFGEQSDPVYIYVLFGIAFGTLIGTFLRNCSLLGLFVRANKNLHNKMLT
jgi:hypothetical protein